MTCRVLSASLAIVCGLGACTAAPPEPLDEAQQETIDESTPPSAEPVLRSTPPMLAATCGEVSCPPEFSNCVFQGDFDCGEEFCRTPTLQCNGELSTFIRVQHVFICSDPAGNQCVALTLGRRLVHCGC